MKKKVRSFEYNTELANELASISCYYETSNELALKRSLYSQKDEGERFRFFMVTLGAYEKLEALSEYQAKEWVKLHARDRYRQIFGKDEAEAFAQETIDALNMLESIEGSDFVYSLLILKMSRMVQKDGVAIDSLRAHLCSKVSDTLSQLISAGTLA